jgi:hypothetical protein
MKYYIFALAVCYINLFGGSWQVYRDIDETYTSSSSWMDMEDMVLNVTVGASEGLFVQFSTSNVRATGTYSQDVDFRILRDATQIARGYVECYKPGGSSDLATQLHLDRIDHPGSGNYTYKVQWRSGGWEVTQGNYATEQGHRCLTVITSTDYMAIAEEGNKKPAPAHDCLFTIEPNPVEHHAVIRFALEKSQEVSITIVDIQGRIIEEVLSENRAAGEHSIHWIPKVNMPSGVYFVALKTGYGIETRKAITITAR